MNPAEALAVKAAAAGALSLSMGAAPLGVLLISRRMSLVGDAMSHGILPGVALAYLAFGPDPLWLTAGALVAAALVAGLSSLLSRARAIPEDAAFAVFYLCALAIGVLLIGREAGEEVLHDLLFGGAGALGGSGLIIAAGAATATLVSLALFVRGFLGEGADPTFMRASGAPGWAMHLLFMLLVAINLVAGFRAFGALMTVGLMMIPAAGARFWARDYVGQAGVAIGLSILASGAGLLLAARLDAEPGAVMILSAGALFALSAVFGTHNGLIQNLPGRTHLEG